MHGAAVGQLDVELPRLDSSAGVAGARETLNGLLPRNCHNRILLAFGEEQSMPDKRVGFFVLPKKLHRKAVAPASAGGLRAGIRPPSLVRHGGTPARWLSEGGTSS